MPINLDKFFKTQKGQTVDEALIKELAACLPDLLASTNEAINQKGRKIEGHLEKIVALTAEYETLERVSNDVWLTPVTDFEIHYGGGNGMSMDKASGPRVKQVAMDLLSDSLKTNRLEYLTSSNALLKLK